MWSIARAYLFDELRTITRYIETFQQTKQLPLLGNTVNSESNKLFSSQGKRSYICFANRLTTTNCRHELPVRTNRKYSDCKRKNFRQLRRVFTLRHSNWFLNERFADWNRSRTIMVTSASQGSKKLFFLVRPSPSTKHVCLFAKFTCILES